MAGELAAPGTAPEPSRLESPWRARLSPWRLLVAASALALAAAAAVMIVLWLTSSGKRSTAYPFSGPLLGIAVDVERGDVHVVGGGRTDAHVRRTERFAYHQEPRENLTLERGVLQITSRCADLVLGTCAADYAVSVPDNVPVTISVAEGSVHVVDYRGSAQLTARDGAIEVERFCGFVLQATARHGDIRVATECAPERLELRSDSGDVTALVPPGAYRIDADSTGGRVVVRGLTSTDDTPWFIQALSRSGDVTVAAQS